MLKSRTWLHGRLQMPNYSGNWIVNVMVKDRARFKGNDRIKPVCLEYHAAHGTQDRRNGSLFYLEVPEEPSRFVILLDSPKRTGIFGMPITESRNFPHHASIHCPVQKPVIYLIWGMPVKT